MSAIVKYSFTSLFPHTVVPHKQLLCFPIQETQIDIYNYIGYSKLKRPIFFFSPSCITLYTYSSVNVCAKFLQLCPILVSHHWSELLCSSFRDLPEPGSNPSFYVSCIGSQTLPLVPRGSPIPTLTISFYQLAEVDIWPQGLSIDLKVRGDKLRLCLSSKFSETEMSVIRDLAPLYSYKGEYLEIS